MSNISKQFNKISKKRELSGKSNPEDDRKKAREGSFTTSDKDGTEHKVFRHVSTTNDISEVLKYLKTLEVKISEIYNLSNDTRSMQIKGNKQLADLTQPVKFMSEKFKEFEKDCKEKEKVINSLEQGVNGRRKG